MRTIINAGVGILLVLLAGATVQADLQSAENFTGRTEAATIDNLAGNGVLGGMWDTEGETTGNITTRAQDGSMTLRVTGHSGGLLVRGAGIAGLSNTISNTETGVLFFRLKAASGTRPLRDYVGMHTFTSGAFLTGPTCVAGSVNAGFGLSCPASSATFDIVTTNNVTVLRSGLARNQWYNVWIVANNAADTFDLYVNTASGPGGPVELPLASNIIGTGLAFGTATTSPLAGVMYVKSSSTPVAQTEDVYIDDIYWDGDAGLTLKTKAARNPVPEHRATQVALNQILSWDRPDDPNVAHVLGYDVYLGINETDVKNGEPSALVSAGQPALTFDPIPDLAYDTQYFWRVESTIRMDDPNQTLLIVPGSVWSFTTMSSLPIITQQPANVTAESGQTVNFTVAADSVSPVSYQWYKSNDAANNTVADDVLISGATAATLTLSNVSAAAEGFYYCKVSNPSVVYSNAASLGVKRKLAHWTLNKSDYDAANERYLDTVGGYHAAVATAGSVPVFVDGAAVPAADGAVAFDPNTRGVVGLLNPSALTNQMTLSGWVKWDGGPLNEFGNVILQKGAIYDTWMWSLKVRGTSDGKVGLWFYNNFGYSAQGANLIESNVWTHVCATWDGTAARVYINGVLAATDTTGAMGPDTLGDLQIAGGDDFPGALDDIQIYNTAFDVIAIAHLYAAVSGKSVCVNPNDPILLAYDFNKNCVVDLADFALLASRWMECFLVPDCIERP